MTDAYQRGNRDGLLAFAAWAEGQATTWGDEVERCTRVLDSPVNRIQERAAKHLEQHALVRMVAYRDAADHARRMADRLPLDPEADDDDQ